MFILSPTYLTLFVYWICYHICNSYLCTRISIYSNSYKIYYRRTKRGRNMILKPNVQPYTNPTEIPFMNRMYENPTEENVRYASNMILNAATEVITQWRRKNTAQAYTYVYAYADASIQVISSDLIIPFTEWNNWMEPIVSVTIPHETPNTREALQTLFQHAKIDQQHARRPS